jgi:predicted LPLAT superfamily acyltransferase
LKYLIGIFILGSHLGDKEILAKLFKMESSIEEVKMDVAYIKNAISELIDFMKSNSIGNELLQRDMIIYESLTELKIILNEILDVVCGKLEIEKKRI